MAIRSLSHRAITPTATADTTNLVDSTYPFAIQGASGTQRTNITEIFIGGQAAASAPTFMCFGRDSQIATGALTADATMNDAPIQAPTAALAAAVATFNKAATNKPQRSVTLGCLVNLSLNCFGGIVRWVAPDVRSFISMVGNTASLGECSLSAFSGGTAGAMGAHLMYETD
jgi:hypothetical protein